MWDHVWDSRMTRPRIFVHFFNAVWAALASTRAIHSRFCCESPRPIPPQYSCLWKWLHEACAGAGREVVATGAYAAYGFHPDP